MLRCADLVFACGSAAVPAVSRGEASDRGIAFRPSCVLLQDLSGVPALVDLAAQRDALAARGGDPDRVNPVVPVDVVVDQSLVVDEAGHPGAMAANVAREYDRNAARYAFLRWAEGAFRNFRVAPPGAGILHPVAVEHLAQVAARDGELVFPKTLAGGAAGGVTLHLPSGEMMDIPYAAARYAADDTPLVVVAGRDYGTGSSRDWAAKGTRLLGIEGLVALVPGGMLRLRIGAGDWPLRARHDNPWERATWRAGGILPEILARFTTEETP